MIYQVKITLQHTKPPVWRRILVPYNMSLTELHETIQIAFDWSGFHLHCFEARKTNGMNLTSKGISIGINDDEFLDMIEYDYEEEEEKVSDWLVKEKDKLMYVYDFGDDWRHEIVLEKILEPNPDLHYPYCVKALRGPVEEDSGGFAEDVEEVDPKELQEEINVQLQSMFEENSAVEEKLAEGHWNRLFQLAKQFNELAPWNWLDDDQIFAIQNPKTGEYMYCSVMGAMGEEFGLAAFKGEIGLAYLRKMMATPHFEQDALYDNYSLVLSLCDRDEISPEDYELIKNEGFLFRGKKNWPMFRSLVPGYFPWKFSNDEAELFMIILERAIEVCTRAKEVLTIDAFGEKDVCFAQSAVDKEGQLVWEDAFISTIVKEVDDQPSNLLVSELELQKLKSKTKKFNTPLEIGTFYNPGAIQERPHDRPLFFLVMVAAERKREMIVYHDMFSPVNKEKSIQSAFLKLIDQLEAIPREVWLTRDVFLILQPILERLKISAIQLNRLPIIANVKKGMFSAYNQGWL